MIRREDREALEHENLSPFAAFADAATRQGEADSDPLRTAFQRDRDRILHSKAFRRLSHKTQVFVAPVGDHYRTRLTHTLEVTQIARSIARALALNEDLTEAIGLAHDLGHTPYGHSGETALSHSLALYQGLDPREHPRLFCHNEQSLRVVDVLEHDGKGLNLTNEVRDGILHHTGTKRAATLEGRIVATADRIAYVNHDIDDALRAGLITSAMLPTSTHTLLGSTHSQRITTLVQDMIESSDKTGDITMSPLIWDAMMELREFLFDKVYLRSNAKFEEPKATELVCTLFEHYSQHLDELPEEYMRIAQGEASVAVVDYISCMTDRYATATFEKLFMPFGWRDS